MDGLDSGGSKPFDWAGRILVRAVGVEPTLLSEPDFESGASANSTTPATINFKVFSASSAILCFQGAAKLEQKKWLEMSEARLRSVEKLLNSPLIWGANLSPWCRAVLLVNGGTKWKQVGTCVVCVLCLFCV